MSILGITSGGGSTPPDAATVLGPASATDNAVVRFDGTTGKLTQNSSVIVDDSGGVSIGSSLTLGDTPSTPDVGIARSLAGRLTITAGVSGYGEIELASGVIIKAGNGDPEGVVVASPGSLYLNGDGGLLTTVYAKRTGNGDTGWVGFV